VAENSAIEWTSHTWNFVTGCTKVSEGCRNCYITTTVPFRVAGRRFDHDGIGATTGVQLHSDRLHWPLTKWKTPAQIFVNSLADLFHDEVPDRFIADAFAVMSLATQHTFQVLTKRPARMRALLRSGNFWAATNAARMARGVSVLPGGAPLVLPNVHLGVSVESQQWADIRIPQLLGTPAAVRWLSCEPLLGPVDLDQPRCDDHDRLEVVADATGQEWCAHCAGDGFSGELSYGHWLNPLNGGIQWVVCGGESGRGARPMHPDWARKLRDQCAASDVPFFYKQWGQHAPVTDRPQPRDLWVAEDGTVLEWSEGDGHNRVGGGDFLSPNGRAVLMRRHRGKHDAGRLLDGRAWDEFPRQPESVSTR
jgi:protein gp37